MAPLRELIPFEFVSGPGTIFSVDGNVMISSPALCSHPASLAIPTIS